MTDEGRSPVLDARFPGLEGKVAIVSGASRGIGCGIAEVLAAQGMKLVLCARSEDKGLAFTAELQAQGADCLWVTADLTTPEGARDVFDAAIERHGGIDLLVNNAARLHGKPFLELDEDEYVAAFEGNVRMVYGLSYLVAHHMVESGKGGNIIHISSVGGLRGHRGKAGYDASKGAIDALTRSMAAELAPHGIRVNAVAPGLTLKPGLPARRKRRLSDTVKGIPLGRPGRPEDIGAAVAFLAAETGAYITGQVIYVDGGLTAQLTPPGINI